MKALIVIAAATIAFPVYAQQTPNAQERAENREKVQNKVDKAEDKLPSASERAQNREKVQDKLPTAEERANNREKVATTASNATLTGKVKSALASDAGAKTMTNINVDSNNGVVTLKGRVDTADAKKKAAEIAKKVEGVKSVKNELKVEKKS
jgi:hyperosmotically inducible periplasmic protein